MLSHLDLAEGKEFENIKTGDYYTITSFSFHSETQDYQVNYVKSYSNGPEWTRPIGLFLLKFKKKGA